jgi:7,8-dihydropterin-6-yl-methyl-4-(beta-D-ribofuranosyl)aminobenzene 5'-phosphate synthase
MRVTIIFDNTAFREDLRSSWGFSALVETHGKHILFDTGGNGSILLSNMQKLRIDPRRIGDVFISHSHFDHTGGLSSFLEQNPEVTLWVPPSLRGVKYVKEVIEVATPRKMYEGIYSTGELERIEQSLCVETEKGIVVIAGCSHPRMKHILDVAAQFGKVFGIIGGLHGNKPESLKELDLICATHCSQYIAEIKSLYPDQYVQGGAGRVIAI